MPWQLVHCPLNHTACSATIAHLRTLSHQNTDFLNVDASTASLSHAGTGPHFLVKVLGRCVALHNGTCRLGSRSGAKGSAYWSVPPSHV